MIYCFSDLKVGDIVFNYLPNEDEIIERVVIGIVHDEKENKTTYTLSHDDRCNDVFFLFGLENKRACSFNNHVHVTIDGAKYQRDRTLIARSRYYYAQR